MYTWHNTYLGIGEAVQRDGVLLVPELHTPVSTTAHKHVTHKWRPSDTVHSTLCSQSYSGEDYTHVASHTAVRITPYVASHTAVSLHACR